jgi:hypothetical protein
MTEAQLVTKILGTLNRVPGVFAFKIVAAPYARAGISDILGCCRGRFFAFEVKLPSKEKNLTVPQGNFQASVNLAGGTAYTVTSVEQALTYLNALIESEQQVRAALVDQVCRLTQPGELYGRPTGPHD